MGWSGLHGDAALFVPIFLGFATGTLARYLMLVVDYRQYPTYPHGYISHLGLGSVAALVGAVTLPALMEKEFTAVTFLMLVATQFREIRKIERDMLVSIESQQLVKRGADYIEGIARVFEVRNYLVIGVALVASGSAVVLPWPIALLLGLITIYLVRQIHRGQTLDTAVHIREGKLRFEGANLFVDHIHIMNIGIPEQRQQILEWGVGVILEPISSHGRRILAHPGQRQAMLHDITSLFGMRKDVDTPELTPMARKDKETGALALFLTPQDQNVQGILEAINRTPLLEGSRGGSRAEMGMKTKDD